MKKTELYIPSTTGNDLLRAILWEPEGEVKAVMQISHGMIEHIGRYERLAKYLTDRGFVVIGNDHLGHGKTAVRVNYGYFTSKVDSSRYVVRDLHRVSLYIRRAYPDVPFFLLGHSMGSFMARRYATMYGKELDGLILLGTGWQPEGMLKIGLHIARILTAIKGNRANSWLLEKICFSLYNKRCKPVRTSSDWLTTDEKSVDLYRSDPYCNFKFTLNGYQTLFESISYVQDRRNIKRIPKSLPILCMSGEGDPVGEYGSGVKKVVESYRKNGVWDVTCYLYKEARHELLHEREYIRYQEDMMKWLEKRFGDILN